MSGSGSQEGGDHGHGWEGGDSGEFDLLTPVRADGRSVEYTLLVREMAAELYRYASTHVDEGLAEDVVSDVFLVLWRRWEAIPGDHDGRRAWVYEAMKRTILDARARDQRRRRLTVRLASSREKRRAEQPGDGLMAEEALSGLLGSLPRGQADALRLTVIDGLSAQEAAQRLGVSVTVITSRLHRARITLKAALDDQRRRTS